MSGDLLKAKSPLDADSHVFVGLIDRQMDGMLCQKDYNDSRYTGIYRLASLIK